MSLENRPGQVLAAFNSVAAYKSLYARLDLMLQEIRLMLDNAQMEGLKEKACAAIPLWVEWQEWHREHLNGGELLRNPNVAETDLILNAAALGSEPRDIMREVMQLRAENGLNDTPRPVDASSTFLDRFNEFAEVKVLTKEMWMRLEEIEIAVRGDQGEGLQAKCEVAIQFWEIWVEWRRAHSDAKDPAEFERRREPQELQVDSMLKLGILGWEPEKIRRRLEQRRQENGWPVESAPDAATCCRPISSARRECHTGRAMSSDESKKHPSGLEKLADELVESINEDPKIEPGQADTTPAVPTKGDSK